MRPTKIIVHHSLTEDSGTVSWLAIRKYHIETNGWSDIGYHAGIELVKTGDIISIEALMGRMWNIPGAHCAGQNHDSLGICFIGNFDKVSPSDEIFEVGAKIIRLWIELFKIPIGEIYPHRLFNLQKTCPGKLFNMDRLMSFIE